MLLAWVRKSMVACGHCGIRPPPPNWWKYAVTVSVSGREAPRDVTSMRGLKKGAILEPKKLQAGIFLYKSINLGSRFLKGGLNNCLI